MKLLKSIKQLSIELNAEYEFLPNITIENGALQLIPSYLQEYQKVVLVVDDNTYKQAGKYIHSLLNESGKNNCIVTLQANSHGQVLADEQTLVQLLLDAPGDTDVFLAIGSGTIHDIVRFVADKLGVPFISVPTAASVDGFTSKGAPLIIKGFKQTIQTTAPIAVFGDIQLIKNAPKEMTAAGVGDIIGKFTSLLDWKISYIIGNEPYNQLAADITRQSLRMCVDHIDKIADRKEEGIRILMESLIASGLVMLLLNHSRPASGGEHHLSHFWEIDLLRKDQKQLLHGAKVGVATAIISNYYKQWLQFREKAGNTSGFTYKEKLSSNWLELKDEIKELPSNKEIKQLLKMVDGPTTPKQLGISEGLVEVSLKEAHHLRDRCTGLYLINQPNK